MRESFNLTAVVEKRSNNVMAHSKKQVEHDRRMDRDPVTLSSSFEKKKKTNSLRVYSPKRNSLELLTWTFVDIDFRNCDV